MANRTGINIDLYLPRLVQQMQSKAKYAWYIHTRIFTAKEKSWNMTCLSTTQRRRAVSLYPSINKVSRCFSMWTVARNVSQGFYDKPTVSVCFHSNRNGVHAVYNNEPALLVLENLAFLLFDNFCSKNIEISILPSLFLSLPPCPQCLPLPVAWLSNKFFKKKSSYSN